MIYKIQNKKILIAIILLLIVINVVQFKTTRDYEKYLSSKVRNMVSVFSSNILENDILLEEAINNGEITNRKLNKLGRNFLRISIDYYELSDIYDIKSKRKNINPSTAEIADDCSMYISMKMLGNYGNQYKMIKDEHTIKLSNEHIKSLQIMKEVTKDWSSIIKDNVKGATPDGMESIYWDEYDRAINNKYWKNVLDELGDFNKELNWNKKDFED